MYGYKTIGVKETTFKRLIKDAGWEESMDCIINRLLDHQKKSFKRKSKEC